MITLKNEVLEVTLANKGAEIMSVELMVKLIL